MGGYGSGRRGGRATVEDCLSLSINKYAQWGYLKPGHRAGNLTWSINGNEIGSCGFYSHVDDHHATMTFNYNYKGEKHPDVEVNLCWYSPGFGGRRYLFLCPFCGRKMRTLQIRRGEIACRICHRLTYTSCNENHKYDSLYKLMARDDSKFTWFDYKRSFKEHTKKR